MFLVLQPITAKIKTSALATKPRTYYIINVVACGLVFSRPIGSFLATTYYFRNIFLVFLVLLVWLHSKKEKHAKVKKKTTICNEGTKTNNQNNGNWIRKFFEHMWSVISSVTYNRNVNDNISQTRNYVWKEYLTLAFFFMCLRSPWTACLPGLDNVPWLIRWRRGRWKLRRSIRDM